MANPIELRRQLAALSDQALALIAKADAEQRALNAGETRRLDEWMARMETLRDDIERREKLEGYTGPIRPAGDEQRARRAPAYHPRRTEDNESAILARWVRTGDPGAQMELRAYNDVDMIVGQDAEGGVVVPTSMLREVIARRDEQMLAVKLGCREIPGKGLTVTVPVDNEADVLYAAVGEASVISQDSPAMTEATLTLSKYAKYTSISWELQLTEDAGLIDFLSGWMARGMAATHNNLLVAEVLANGTAGLTLDSATGISAGEIPEFVGKIAPEYQDGSKWLMNPATFSYLQGLSSANPFLFAPTPGGDPRGMLWGYPLVQSSYMPTIAASAKSLVFGNWQYMGYRDPGGLYILRDEFSDAVNGRVRLWSYFFTVYATLMPEALAFATNPTS